MNALFDLDGTLCDPREGIAHGFRHAFDVLGRAYPGDAAVTPLIGLPLQDCFVRLGFQDPAQSEEAARHFQAFFEGRGFAEAKLYPGVDVLLGELRRQGWGLAIASAKPAFAVRFVVQGLGIAHHFDGLHGCAPQDLAPSKAPIVAEALASLGWQAQDTVMIGDRAQDRDAAAAHGLRFIGAAWGFGEPDELKGAQAVAGDLAALRSLLLTL